MPNPYYVSPVYQDFRNQYMQDIEKYKGTKYYDMLLNNPYLSSGSEYSPTWWEENVSQQLFGDYSLERNFYAGRNQQAQEYMSQIVNSMTADALNSPLEKVARDKAAGLNSDLLGVQAADSTASGISPDEVPPTYPEQPSFSDRLTQVASLSSDFFKGLMEFGSFYMDMQSKSIKNTMDDVLTSKTAYDTVLEFLAGNEHFQVGDDGKVLPLDEDTFVELQDSLVSAFGKSALTKKGKSLLKYMRGRVMYDKSGKPTLAYQNKRAEMVAKYLGNQMQSAKVASSKAYDDDLLQFISKYRSEFQSITDAATQAIEKAKKAAAERQTAIDETPDLGTSEGKALKAKAGYESGLYGATFEGDSLGTAEGEARVVAARKAKARDTMDKKIDETFATLQRKLDQDKSSWGILCSMLLPLLRAKVNQLLEFNPMNLIPALLP